MPRFWTNTPVNYLGVNPDGTLYQPETDLGFPIDTTDDAKLGTIRTAWADEVAVERAGVESIRNVIPNPRGRSNASGWSRFITGGSSPTATSVADAPTEANLGFTEGFEVVGTTATATNVSTMAYVENAVTLAGWTTNTMYVSVWMKLMSSTATGLELRLRGRMSDATYLGSTGIIDFQSSPVAGTWYFLSGRFTKADALASYPTATKFGFETMLYAAGSAATTHTYRAAAPMMVPIDSSDPDPFHSSSSGPYYFDGDTSGCAWAGTAHNSASIKQV